MKVFRPIACIIFSLLVLFSATSFKVGVHFCGGKVQEVAIFHEADGCGHAKLPPCHKSVMKSCCENEVIVHEGQGFGKEFSNLNIEKKEVIEVATLPAILIAEVIPSCQITFPNASKDDIPVPLKDRVVLHQVFLI